MLIEANNIKIDVYSSTSILEIYTNKIMNIYIYLYIKNIYMYIYTYTNVF